MPRADILQTGMVTLKGGAPTRSSADFSYGMKNGDGGGGECG